MKVVATKPSYFWLLCSYRIKAEVCRCKNWCMCV